MGHQRSEKTALRELHPVTHIDGWANTEKVCLDKGAWPTCSLEKVTDEEWALVWPDHPKTEEEDKRHRGQRCRAEGCYQSNHSSATVPQTDRLQASLVQSFKQECRPSETPAVLEFQHSLQKVLKEKKKKKVPKPHWTSESHRCRNAEVLHSLILIFTLMAVNLLISESLLLKWI